MYTHEFDLIRAGIPLASAQKAIVLLHGRGGSPEDIISLQKHLAIGEMSILAPRATHTSWYPKSFLAPVAENQPALDSALEMIGKVVDEIQEQGILPEHIYFAGFSQGACLSLEYVARNAKRYGGVIALTGGLIGETIDESNYKGDFAGTPIFISTGDPDPHVPVERVKQSIAILERKGAFVTFNIYPGRPHTILPGEIKLANEAVMGGD